MKGRPGIAALLFSLLPALAFAGESMDVGDVLDLLEAGISERVIVAQIEASGSDFDLTTEDILRLEEEGVGERIVEAMIRSGSAAGEEEVEREVEETVYVPAHLGFDRYRDPGYVTVRLVPWSVPDVRYVYVDPDPWWWDPWWWDTPYYVSYHGYPVYRSGLYLSWSWGSWGSYACGVYGYGYGCDAGYYGCDYGWGHHNGYSYATHAAYGHAAWKKKSTRSTSAGAVATARSGSKYRAPAARRASHGVSGRKESRSPARLSRVSASPSRPAPKGDRYRSREAVRRATRSTSRVVERLVPRSSGRSLSRHAPPASASRSKGERSSARSRAPSRSGSRSKGERSSARSRAPSRSGSRSKSRGR